VDSPRPRAIANPHDLDKDAGGVVVNNMVASVRENAMRSLVAAVFSVATLLSVSSNAFAQGAQPGPGPAPAGAPGAAAPSPQILSSGTDHTPPIIETGRYHPCPASVGFSPGRSVCLGLDEPSEAVAMLGLAFVLELLFKSGLLSFRSLPLAPLAAIRRASSRVSGLAAGTSV
jgi:hypothetical protein